MSFNNMGAYENQQKIKVSQQPGGNSSLSLGWGHTSNDDDNLNKKNKYGGNRQFQQYGQITLEQNQGYGANRPSYDQQQQQYQPSQQQQDKSNVTFGARVAGKGIVDYQQKSSIRINNNATNNNVIIGDYDYFKQDNQPRNHNITSQNQSNGQSYNQRKVQVQQPPQYQHGQNDQQQYPFPIFQIEKQQNQHDGLDEFQLKIAQQNQQQYLNSQKNPYSQGSNIQQPQQNYKPSSQSQQNYQNNQYQSPQQPQQNYSPYVEQKKNLNHPHEGFSNGYRVNQPPGGKSNFTFG